MKNHELGSLPMTRLMFRMGIPSMAGMLVVALYNVVDTYFIAGLGTQAVAAASVVFPIMMLVSGIGFAFGSGAATLISRLLGSNEKEEANIVASTAFYSAVFAAIVMAAMLSIFLNPVLKTFGAHGAVIPYARQYGLIILVGSVLNVATVTANNMVRAEGLARVSMITMLIGALANIILDPILIYWLDFGISGAAIATVIAQSCALAYILYQYGRGKTTVSVGFRKIRIDRRIYGGILKVGIPVLIYQGLNSLSIAIVNQQAAFFGASAVAAMGIVTKIMVFVSYVVFGFVKGLQPIIGYNYGAGDYRRVAEGIHHSSVILSVYCLVASIVVVGLSATIIGYFSIDAAVLAMGERVLIAWCMTFVLLGFQMTYVTAFLAMGMIKEGSVIGLSRQGLLLIPLLILLRMLLGFDGIVLSQPIADLLTFLLAVRYAWRVHRHLAASSLKRVESMVG